MIIFRFACVAILLLSFNIIVFSQDPANNIVDYKIKGSSDNVSQSYNEYSTVDYYRGIMKFNLPVYKVVEKNLELPISLSYNGGGVKVDQVPTWTGLGWTLLAGGSISRSTRGTFDELPQRGYTTSKNFNQGQLYVQPDTYNLINNSFQSNPDVRANDNKWSCALCGNDSQPDEFFLNVPGLSTAFFINQDGIPVSKSKIKISYSLNAASNRIIGWEIVSEDGIVYKFDQVENSSTIFGGHTWRSRGGNSPNVGSSWYLTKIMSADRSSEISLQYVRDTDSQRFRQFAAEYSLSNVFFFSTSTATTQTNSVGQYQSVSGITWIDPVYLTRIVTSNFDITFDRELSTSSFEARRLARINILKKNNEVVKSFQFSYKNYYGTALDGVTSDNRGSFFLTSMQESAGTTSEPPFKFEYDETPIAYGGDLAETGQFCGIDHWGYYNGPKSNFSSRIPAGVIAGINPNLQGISDREPNNNFVRAGSLVKVINPYGGNTQFEYDQHEYSFNSHGDAKSFKVKGGGLRIKKIVTHDASGNSPDIVRTFSYDLPTDPSLSSGVIQNDPTYNYQYNSESSGTSYRPFSGKVWLDDPILPIDIGYSSVKENFANNGYKLYTYTTSRDYPYVSFNQDISYVINETYYKRFEHPFFKNRGRFDYMRGLLLEEAVYDQENSIKKRTTNFFRPIEIDKLFSIERLCFGDFSFFNTTPHFVYFSRNYYIPIGRAMLAHTETSLYKPNSNSSSPSLTESVDLEYNSNYQLSKRTTFTSDGYKLVDRIRYASDFIFSTNPSGNAGGIKTLQTKNMITQQVENYQVKMKLDGSMPLVTSGSLQFFNVNGYLDKTLKFDIRDPLPEQNYIPSYVEGNEVIGNNGYSLETTVQNYDGVGNPTDIINNGGTRQGFQWGYNNSKLIAKISNAKSSEVYFQNFEESLGNSSIGDAKTGNLSRTGGFTVTVNGLRVNSKYILSYHEKINGGWVYRRQAVHLTNSNYLINLSGQIDDIRLYPYDATLITYTHDLVYGVTSVSDSNGKAQYQEYDALGRVITARDDKGSIISAFSYKFKEN